MKFKQPKRHNTCVFAEVPPASVFRCEQGSGRFLKLDTPLVVCEFKKTVSHDMNAVCLLSGTRAWFAEDCSVVRVEGTFVEDAE